MKIKQEHLEHMRLVIEQAKPKLSMAHQPAPLLGDYLKAGMSAMRWRWDMANYTGLIPWFCEHIYPYANDDHIDTALRTITKTK